MSVGGIQTEHSQPQEGFTAVRIELEGALVCCLGLLEASEAEIAGGNAQPDLRRTLGVIPQSLLVPSP